MPVSGLKKISSFPVLIWGYPNIFNNALNGGKDAIPKNVLIISPVCQGRVFGIVHYCREAV